MKNLSVYAVRYDANTDVGGGANDLSAHLQQTANNCPDTKLVVGGYSLGAGVVDTALGVPGPVQIGNFFLRQSGTTRGGRPHPRDRDIRQHRESLCPVQSLAGAYGDRVLDLCNDGDPVCMDGNQDTWKSHTSYPPALINQAADFAAARVN